MKENPLVDVDMEKDGEKIYKAYHTNNCIVHVTLWVCTENLNIITSVTTRFNNLMIQTDNHINTSADDFCHRNSSADEFCHRNSSADDFCHINTSADDFCHRNSSAPRPGHFISGERVLVPTALEAGWAPELVCTTQIRENSSH
jgi:hypothetical protein